MKQIPFPTLRGSAPDDFKESVHTNKEVCTRCTVETFFKPVFVYSQFVGVKKTDRENYCEFGDYFLLDSRTTVAARSGVKSYGGIRIFDLNNNLIFEYDYNDDISGILIYSFQIEDKTFFCYLLGDDLYLLPTNEKILSNVPLTTYQSETKTFIVPQLGDIPIINGRLYVARDRAFDIVFPMLTDGVPTFSVVQTFACVHVAKISNERLCICNPNILVWHRSGTGITYLSYNGGALHTSKSRFLRWTREADGTVTNEAIEATPDSIIVRQLNPDMGQQPPEKNESGCHICKTQIEKFFVLLPCGHMYFCETCIKDLIKKKQLCVCGSIIKQHVRVYPPR